MNGRQIDAERMQAELRHAAVEARRTLHDAADAIGVPNMFEVLRGEPGETIAAALSAGDVIVLAAPANAGARLAPAFTRMHAAAQGSAASVLLLPIGLAARKRPVVAIVAGAGDPSLAFAARLAIGARENLLLLVPQDGRQAVADAIDHAVEAGMPRSHVAARRLAGLQAEDVLHALGHVQEHLIVVTHDACPAGGVDDASRMAANRGVPVLLVEPDQAAMREMASTTADSGAAGSATDGAERGPPTAIG